MDLGPEVQALAASLASSAARNGARIVWDRVTTAKASNKTDEAIGQLEQIITDLIADKNELLNIAQSYQGELVAQRLNPGDVRYISDTVVPLVEKLASLSSGGDPQRNAEMVEALKPILSVETVNVLQLLGFNFREAIGEPLTALLARAILSRSAPDSAAAAELTRLQHEKEIVYARIALDAEAHARLRQMYGT